MKKPVFQEETEEAPDPCAGFYFPEQGDDDPREIAAALIAELPEFNELRIGEAKIMVAMRVFPKQRNGRSTLGEMALPRFMGALGQFASWLLAMFVTATGGDQPDFIMTLDSDWWNGSNRMQRTGLVHHELMHCEQGKDREGEPKFDDEGKPVWGLKGHHLEEFRETVERYGDFAGDVTPFVAAAKRGGVNPAP